MNRFDRSSEKGNQNEGLAYWYHRCIVACLFGGCKIPIDRYNTAWKSGPLTMGQSNYIAGFLIIGFIVFITLRGELPAYRAILGI